MLILATGFDAMTGAITQIDIRGPDGDLLKERWAAGAGAYLGLMAAGFPNLFLMTGPGSPSVLANMVTGLEQHAEWISECIEFLLDNDHAKIEAQAEAQADWMQEVGVAAEGTLFTACNSWYVGANIPGKPRVFLPYIGGFDRYEALCHSVADSNYRGFTID
jgi:cyclohexanone monooxygenase